MLMGILIAKFLCMTMVLRLIFSVRVNESMKITVIKNMIKNSVDMDSVSKQYTQHAGCYHQVCNIIKQSMCT